MKVTKRLTSIKRHTIGYLVGGRYRTRREAVQLALQGRIEGVAVRYSAGGNAFIASLPGGENLYDLPVRIEDRTKASRRAAR